MIWTAAFWRGAAERAIKTFAQAVVAVIAVGELSFRDVDWATTLSVAGVAALASVLTSLGSISFVSGE